MVTTWENKRFFIDDEKSIDIEKMSANTHALLEALEAHIFANDKRKKTVYTSAELTALIGRSATYAVIKAALGTTLLVRVTKGFYAYPHSKKYRIEMASEFVKAFRPKALTYESIDSALNEWGCIKYPSRWDYSYLTTGASAKFCSKIGNFKFVHTSQDVAKLFANRDVIIYQGYERIPLAKPWLALSDYHHCRRCEGRLDHEDYYDCALDFLEHMKEEWAKDGIEI